MIDKFRDRHDINDNMYKDILLLAGLYKRHIHRTLGIHVKFNINLGKNICMARIADFKNSTRGNRNFPNINKRCSRTAYDLCLCKAHLKSLAHGRGDEYPSEDMIYHYQKQDPDVVSKIKLIHHLFKKRVKLKSLKNLNVIIRMSFKTDKTKIKNIPERSLTKESLENLYEELVQREGLDKHFVTIKEKNDIISDIQKYGIVKKTLTSFIETIKISTLNSLSIRDNNLKLEKLYKLNYNSKCYLLTCRKKVVGQLQYWIDEDDIVPKEFKTADNKVLNPSTNLPILEATLNRASDLYCDILPGIYREFIYRDDIEAFMISNQVLI